MFEDNCSNLGAKADDLLTISAPFDLISRSIHKNVSTTFLTDQAFKLLRKSSRGRVSVLSWYLHPGL
jgi:hypothetical protein